MKKINYLIGDATNPHEVSGTKLLIHVCNNKRAWGAGFVLALSKKWKEPEMVYREHPSCHLGQVQMVQVEKDIFVINMIAQELGWKDGQPPIRYGALTQCLQSVNTIADAMGATIVAPRFGAGLAGGKWDKIEKLIKDQISIWGIPVFIYDLPF